MKYNNLKPFKRGYDERRNLAGGPRKLTTTLGGLGYTKNEVHTTVLAILKMKEHEARAIADGDQYTILERTVAAAVLKDMDRGSLWNVETLLDRTLGRPHQSVQQDTAERIEVVFVEGKTIL